MTVPIITMAVKLSEKSSRILETIAKAHSETTGPTRFLTKRQIPQGCLFGHCIDAFHQALHTSSRIPSSRCRAPLGYAFHVSPTSHRRSSTFQTYL